MYQIIFSIRVLLFKIKKETFVLNIYRKGIRGGGPFLTCSVADPGCLSRIPDPTFFNPGSWIRTVSIPDPGSSKNLSILTPKKAKNGF
jgi:hypothetical protein